MHIQMTTVPMAVSCRGKESKWHDLCTVGGARRNDNAKIVEIKAQFLITVTQNARENHHHEAQDTEDASTDQVPWMPHQDGLAILVGGMW